MADTVELMRKRVLEMAIRGELVDQRAEEGTAEELISRFNTAREENIRNSRGKKLEIGDIEPTENPYEVPSNWSFLPLGSLLSIKSGLGYKKANLSVESDDMVRVLRGGNISEGSYELKGDDVLISREFVKDELLLQEQDMISPAVTSLVNIGKIGMIEKDYTNVTAGGFVLIMSPYLKNTWTSKYIFNFLNSGFHRDRLEEITNKSGQAFYNLSRQKLAQLPVPFPPFSEQKRIVKKIEEIFAVIDQIGTKKEEALSIIRNMRQTALQDAIRGVLVDQDENDEPASVLYEKIQAEKEQMMKENKIKKEKPLPEIEVDEIPFDIPESWKWARMGEVGQTSIGLTYKPTDKSENGTIVLRSSNIQNGKMDYSDIVRVDLNIPETKKCEIGDLLICARNGSKRLVGKAALVDEEGHSFGAFMANYRSRFNQYIYYYMRSNFFRSLLGESGTTTINQITQRMLKEFPLPLPPLGEQERIVDKLDEIMAICDQMEAIFDGSSEINEDLKVL